VTEGLPGGLVRDLKLDRKGRLWLGSSEGLARIDNPTAAIKDLKITRFSRKDGLSSDSAYSFVELRDGRMAIGSQRGLSILDEQRRTVTHVTTRDGLPSDEISVVALDHAGSLWLGTIHGLSRLDSFPSRKALAPTQPRIQKLDIDGVPQAVPELGVTSLDGLKIEWPQHALAIGLAVPHFAQTPLRIDYRLSEHDRWTSAGTERGLMFDQLPRGTGALEIRAVTAGGVTSAPARLAFEVVPPFWKRAWFLAIAFLAAASIGIALYRNRVRHLLELERVRTRVATDLHDDLGSSLSRISILSEAAKRGGPSSEVMLDEIANSARGLVDALGDTIWSIDPRRDDVRSLLQRVSRFASPLLESQAVAFEISASDSVVAQHLGPEQRRQVYLILKEALNNAAKHANARTVTLAASTEMKMVRIAIRDDGQGFTSDGRARDHGGHGLPNMKERARRAGGELRVESGESGTTVTVSVPVG
jgi:signal transduction histidine kinase